MMCDRREGRWSKRSEVGGEATSPRRAGKRFRCETRRCQICTLHLITSLSEPCLRNEQNINTEINNEIGNFCPLFLDANGTCIKQCYTKLTLPVLRLGRERDLNQIVKVDRGTIHGTCRDGCEGCRGDDRNFPAFCLPSSSPVWAFLPFSSYRENRGESE